MERASWFRRFAGCCLAPRDDDRREEISSVTLRMEKRYTRVPIPWCGSCRGRRGAYGWLALACVLVTAIPLYFLLALWLGNAAIFVALIPLPTDGPTQPIRLLPATRTKYGVLPGSGATSHENFRRLVRHLKAKNPALAIEPESTPYLEEGKGFPPALPTADALVEYESQFSVLRTEAR
jgi:hypothetical protein